MAFNIAFKFLSTIASLAGIFMLLRSVVSEFFLEVLRSQFFSFFHYLNSETAFLFSTSEMFNIASTLLSTSASLAGTLMLLQIMPSELIPEQLRSHLFSILPHLLIPSSSNLTIVINECSGTSSNEVYNAVYLYLPTKIRPKTERLGLRLGLSKTERQNHFVISIEKDGEIVDIFDGIRLKWKYNCIEPRNKYSTQKKFFELSFNKKFTDKVFDVYLPRVLAKAKQIEEESRVVKIYNRGYPCGNDDTVVWSSMILEHPATFDTLAMDPELKKMIIDDLGRFVRRREFYKKVGKAWKRTYLLYGPPGTEKSSLIAAMADYLKFDIYNLDLASIYSNSDLGNVLLSTKNRSILAIENIDCSIQVQGRENRWESDNSNRRLTLSGILNSIDGLLSRCGDEKIIVFTTNDWDSLDPALLHPGRMDMHIPLSYCTPRGFRFLAENYIGINDHELFGEIEEAIMTTEVTPAEVAEQLMRNNNDPDALLNDLIQFLKVKKRGNEEAKAKKGQEESCTTRIDSE